MFELRPMVYDPDTMYVLGGNKRLLCLNELKYKEVPDSWVKSAEDFSDEEKQRFMLEDNLGRGTWDWEMLDSWDKPFLDSIGLVKFEVFQPTLDPSFAGKEVTQEELDKMNERLQSTNGKLELKEVMCPHCLKEFTI